MRPELAITRHTPRCFSVISGDLADLQSPENAVPSVAAPQCLG
jgi:hypothetical protein